MGKFVIKSENRDVYAYTKKNKDWGMTSLLHKATFFDKRRYAEYALCVDEVIVHVDDETLKEHGVG